MSRFCHLDGAPATRDLSHSVEMTWSAPRRSSLNVVRFSLIVVRFSFTAVFTLKALDLCSFSSLSLLTFCRTKSYKNARHKFRKSFKALARELLCNITHPPFTYRSCLSFQSREQKNSLHALPTSHGAHAQTLLFLFLYWN